MSPVLADEGIDRAYLARHTKRLIESNDENVASRNVALGWQLTDSMPATRNVNVNLNVDVHPVDLSKYQYMSLKYLPPVPLQELKALPTIQSRWTKILSLAA